MTQRFVRTEKQREAAAQAVATHDLPFTLAIAKGAKRSDLQNALIHKWFQEISSQLGDVDFFYVKAKCNVDYGVPIRMADPVFAWTYRNSVGKLSYEKQIDFFHSTAKKKKSIFPITSSMLTKELSQYMDRVWQEYAINLGLRLTDPEALKYEAEFNEPNR